METQVTGGACPAACRTPRDESLPRRATIRQPAAREAIRPGRTEAAGTEVTALRAPAVPPEAVGIRRRLRMAPALTAAFMGVLDRMEALAPTAVRVEARVPTEDIAELI